MKNLMILTISFAMLASPAMARGGHGGHGGHGHAHFSEHVSEHAGSGKSGKSRGGLFSYEWWHGSSSPSSAAAAAASSHSVQCPAGEYRVNGSCTKDKPKFSWW